MRHKLTVRSARCVLFSTPPLVRSASRLLDGTKQPSRTRFASCVQAARRTIAMTALSPQIGCWPCPRTVLTVAGVLHGGGRYVPMRARVASRKQPPASATLVLIPDGPPNLGRVSEMFSLVRLIQIEGGLVAVPLAATRLVAGPSASSPASGTTTVVSSRKRSTTIVITRVSGRRSSVMPGRTGDRLRHDRHDDRLSPGGVG
jgi:hypothetical protein